MAYGFLHIGKTAGTSIRQTIETVRENHGVAFAVFGHNTKLAQIIAEHPETRIAVVLRDPFERLASGFMSRLRAGRPAHPTPWTNAQATAFAHFPTFEDFARGMVSNADRDVSAIEFARRSIGHVSRDYVHHFGSPEMVTANADRFYWVNRLEHLAETLPDMFAPVVSGGGLSADLAAHAHAAPVSAGEIIGALPAGLADAARARMDEDYAVYGALEDLITGPR